MNCTWSNATQRMLCDRIPWACGFLIGALLVTTGCGGSTQQQTSSPSPSTPPPTTSAPNVAPASVGELLQLGQRLFINVTVCVPGTSTCQTINNVAVDTASVGLRIFNSLMTISLPQQSTSTGGIAEECYDFGVKGGVQTVVWGTINVADVKISGETASSVPIQLIGGNLTGTCLSAQQPTDANFNGILGIEPKLNDCGDACANNVTTTPQLYWSCTAASGGICTPQAQPLALQMHNPVTMFPVDNNGILIQLPTVPDMGGTNISGSLIFGIDTESNNKLGGAQVLTLVNPLTGADSPPTTSVGPPNGPAVPQVPALFDTGTSTWGINPGISNPVPALSQACNGYYCPSSPVSLTASVSAQNGGSQVVNFQVLNPATLSGQVTAFNDVAFVLPLIQSPGIGLGGEFIFGLPFFFGRIVYFAYPGAATSGGVGPFVAW